MSNAVERAQDALLWYDRWCVGIPAYLRPTDPREWAAIVRDLLAVPVWHTGADGMHCTACGQAHPDRPETPGMLTEEERTEVAFGRKLTTERFPWMPPWARERIEWLLNIIDRHFPPPAPAHKPCPFCGGRAAVCGLRTAEGPHIRCGACDCRTTAVLTEAEAWTAWDRRTEGGTE